MRSSPRSKSSLKISHTNIISATFEMTHKFQKFQKKFQIFITSTYSIFALTIKISANFLTFWHPIRGPKDRWRVCYIFETLLHMKVEGACISNFKVLEKQSFSICFSLIINTLIPHVLRASPFNVYHTIQTHIY
jgi:hypothetical protein